MSGKIGPGGLLFPPSGHPVRTRCAHGGSRPCFCHPLTRAGARVPAVPGNSPYRPASQWAGWLPRPGTARLLCGGASQRGARDGGNGEEGGGDGACYRMPAGLMAWDDPGGESRAAGSRLLAVSVAWRPSARMALVRRPGGLLDQATSRPYRISWVRTIIVMPLAAAGPGPGRWRLAAGRQTSAAGKSQGLDHA
jgi:hypothetical protein